MSQWADAERRLSSESSAEPGRWNTDRAPYQREMLDALSDPRINTIVVQSSAQVGKTELLLNFIGYCIHYDPSPMLLVQPTLELAEAFSKDRLSPMIRDTPAIKDKLKDPRSRDSGNTLLHKKFSGGQITMAGANSPASLASRPIRIVLLDEVDRYPISAGTEGDPVSLARKRSATFHNRKAVMTSTPTVKGASRIEKAFEDSDKRHYHLPCPHCGEFQKLKFDNIKWDRNDPLTARLICECCRKEIKESEKMRMLMNGKWIAENPFNGIAGFHLNELYSPWRRWSEVVQDYLLAKDDPEMLKTWVNTSLGETWETKGDAPEWKRLYDRREKYQIGKVPAGVGFITAGADVQKDRIECEIVGWGPGKQSWSIDYRVIMGDTATPVPWQGLDALLSEQFEDENSLLFPIRMLAIDSGYNTQVVYNWARKYPMNRVMAVKGNENQAVIIGQPSAVDVKANGTRIRRGFKVWGVGINIVKTELYSWLKLDLPADNESYLPGFCHFPEYAEEYFLQLTAEQIVHRRVKGYLIPSWEKKRERNEALDCRVYARAAAAAVGIDRFKDHDWQSLGSRLQSRSPQEKSGIVTTTQEEPKTPTKNEIPRRKSRYL